MRISRHLCVGRLLCRSSFGLDRWCVPQRKCECLEDCVCGVANSWRLRWKRCFFPQNFIPFYFVFLVEDKKIFFFSASYFRFLQLLRKLSILLSQFCWCWIMPLRKLNRDFLVLIVWIEGIGGSQGSPPYLTWIESNIDWTVTQLGAAPHLICSHLPCLALKRRLHSS
jgi:hypothetical protein